MLAAWRRAPPSICQWAQLVLIGVINGADIRRDRPIHPSTPDTLPLFSLPLHHMRDIESGV